MSNLNPMRVFGVDSNVRIEVTDVGGLPLERFDVHNLITDLALNKFADNIRAEQTEQLDIRYVAIGDSDDPPLAADTTLGNETFRKAITGGSRPSVGVAVTVCNFLTSEANIQWEEIGFYAGANCTASADTGLLVARVLFSHLKDSGESIQVSRRDSIANLS